MLRDCLPEEVLICHEMTMGQDDKGADCVIYKGLGKGRSRPAKCPCARDGIDIVYHSDARACCGLIESSDSKSCIELHH